ncbi:DUF1642 domain-containing protein [Latilactobacillus sakei]|uniref:DUF1642 domain-containing protein n=1 Tax=Latilactobacillus sakei TaxID=1599 RepID=UPI000C6F37FF|nr:DUF1642 domain-containing protein [Latilactobacillus sakei]SON68005.1 protein of unknown function [Latilactobacillus sakei]
MKYEKVKLPKIIFDWLDNEIKQATMRLNVAQPFTTIAAILNEMNKKTFDSDLFWWINLPANQRKLIDALRYGYEAEPEPRWGIKAGNCYMTNPDNYGFDDVTPETAIENDAYWAIKSYADDIVKTLGFGEVVDLNKEGGKPTGAIPECFNNFWKRCLTFDH